MTFADGSQIEVDGVVWATGFRYDHSWIDLPITDADGRVKHRRGVTEIPGLYTLGLQWQYTRGSALLGFVKDDAAFIAEQIAARADAHPAGLRTSPGSDHRSTRRLKCRARSHRCADARRSRPTRPACRRARDRGRRAGRRAAVRDEHRAGRQADRRTHRADARLQRLGSRSDAAGAGGRARSRSRLRTAATSTRPCIGTGCVSTTPTTARTRRRSRWRIGESFTYRVHCPDPGAYWYHPHIREDYGQELGLYGNLIVVPTRRRTTGRRRTARSRSRSTTS